MGDAPVLSHCSLLRILDQNRPVSWNIVVKEKSTVGCPFFEAFPLTTSLRRRRMSMYVSLFTVAVPLNYASEFWELFKLLSVYVFT